MPYDEDNADFLLLKRQLCRSRKTLAGYDNSGHAFPKRNKNVRILLLSCNRELSENERRRAIDKSTIRNNLITESTKTTSTNKPGF